MKWQRIVAKATAVVVAVGATLMAVSTPAQAAETATISRSIYLAPQSTGNAPLPVSAPRRIYLASGTYLWDATISLSGSSVGPERTIYLAAGWYNWRCHINGTGNPGIGDSNYYTYCYLDPENTNYQTVYVPSSGLYYFALPLGGTVNWVSRLDPQF
ncbi:hypothetical protein O7627_30405 [Solwaraspora sp. WMMD1047]|uniref:hypothetical protein n=1 Tax=Solwaraspora sp. WMMD1047 TaxID=3016102 RepID=UPI002415B6D3|nr:hypothetical protein [Solwaraspora sp. WMMD1047]MDG4833588.1 hypothetical protein [Solwaraspora sp. WMMD1047]